MIPVSAQACWPSTAAHLYRLRQPLEDGPSAARSSETASQRAIVERGHTTMCTMGLHG
jgi:hypothetical protein